MSKAKELVIEYLRKAGVGDEEISSFSSLYDNEIQELVKLEVGKIVAEQKSKESELREKLSDMAEEVKITR